MMHDRQYATTVSALQARIARLEQSNHRARRAVAVALGGVLLAVPIFADAVGPTPSVPEGNFASGEPARGSDIYGMFEELYAATNELEARAGTYCGVTGNTIGDLGGHSEAAADCAAVPACSDRARMCTPTGLLHSTIEGMAIPDGWYSTGLRDTVDPAGVVVIDCGGWTSALATDNGPLWSGDTGSGSFATCDSMLPVLCCDEDGAE